MNFKTRNIDQWSETPWIIHRFNDEDLDNPGMRSQPLKKELILKEYQVEGCKWLLEEKGRILADDMGLGKTLQSIAAATKLIIEGKVKNVLIICPSSLIRNWSDELNKWAPNFCVQTITNTGNKKNVIWKKLFKYSHFTITNYEQIRDVPQILLDQEIDLIIADEAHKLRKKNSKISKAIFKLKYKNFWALTGTPIEKNAADVFNLLKMIKPEKNLGKLSDYSNISLRAFLRKHMLRRMKSDVLSDLKDFEELRHFIPLSSEQKLVYDKNIKKLFSLDDDEKLAIFGKLKAICDYDEVSKQSSKLDFIEDLIEKINQREEKCIVFSFSIDPLIALKNRLDKIYATDFSVLFTGSLGRDERHEAINFFKNNNSCSVFLCSGKIGGEGLNLTEANHAIFLNEWWNPSNNNQARDRIIRIGQTKNSFIHHLYTVDTIEEKIIDILNSKKQITTEIIQKLVKESK